MSKSPALNPEQAERLADLKRRLRNARQRALFWSGNPTFTGKRYNVLKSRGSEGYELALVDIINLCDEIEKLSGKRPKESDPKKSFNEKFSKLMDRVTLKKRKSNA